MGHYGDMYAAQELANLRRAWGPIPVIERLREERTLSHATLCWLEQEILEGRRAQKKLSDATAAVGILGRLSK